jgi:putative membrane protein
MNISRSPATFTLASVLAVALLSGCSTMRSPGFVGMGMGPGAPVPASVPVATVAPTFTAVERDFVTQTAAKGMYEVEVSKLAAERGTHEGVRAYARMMVDHHTRANNELIALMSARGVAPPQGLAADRATKLHRLASLPRSAAFDQGYVRVVGVEDHQTSIAQFERARRLATDRELRAWIDRTLSTLRAHLSAAQTLAGTLEG